MGESNNRIGEHYQIRRKLGEGGMGTVYQGKDTRSGETVAIKQLKAEVTNAEMLERFKREGEALRELNHPNIVKMLDAFEADGSHYLVMEYVSGGDLRAVLNEQRKLELKQVLNIAIDLADALTRAHRLDIIHRDLKPENVLITHEGKVRLTDFGIAHVGSKERVTDTEMTMGTFDYLSPEALNGEPTDTRMDIWAFGVILCEMLTGENLFRREQFIETVRAIAIDSLPDLELLAPYAPIALLDLIYRMLEKDAHARIASVRHVGALLEDLLHGRNTPSETRFKIETPTHQFRKHHNLPIQSTAFVGREAELKELDKLLSDHTVRLITVIAPGGMGKTRLALEGAQRHLEQFKDGVYFVDLTPLSDPANIVATIIDSTGMLLSDDSRSPHQQLLDFLSNKQILLVIDNWEHVIEGAPIVTEMLQTASELQIVATSRLRLNQAGETLFHLSGMDFPQWETPEDALEYAAVKLFMSSAKRALPAFELTGENLDYVARICRLVAGMPLGIVLAASWLSLLAPEEIAEEIAHGIEFLESAGGDVPERQRSVQAVFDYSWQMLGADEQSIYMKLSIFRGSFTRQAAQTVAGASLRQLMDLLNQSLLQRDVNTGRFSLHEMARQYAFSKLETQGDVNAMRNAHMRYYAQALHNQLPDLRGSRIVEALDNIELDFENVLTAWHTGFQAQEWQLLALMPQPMFIFTIRARRQEISKLYADAIQHLQPLSKTDETCKILLKNLLVFNVFTDDVPFAEQETLLKLGLEMAREMDDDQAVIAYCLRRVAGVIGDQGRILEAFELAEQAVALARQAHDPAFLANTLHYYGFANFVMGDKVAGQQATQESLHIAREIGNKLWIAATLGNLATGAVSPKERAELTAESLRLRREIGDISGVIFQLGNLASYYASQMEIEHCEEILSEVRVLANEANSAQGYAALNLMQALLLWVRGEPEQALAYIQKGEHFARQDGNQSVLSNYIIYHCLVLLSSGHFEQALVKLKNLLTPKILQIYERTLVTLCVGVLRLLRDFDESIRCVELLGLIHAHPETSPLITQNQYTLKIKAELESTLDSDVYQQAWKRGETLDLGETVMSIVDEYLSKVSE